MLSADADVRAEEVFWAVRKLLEAVARTRPLVLLLEDLHWAEPTLLDLIEYLVGWSRGAPMLVLALARPDLLELRPGWPGERLFLEPLGADELHALLGNLLGTAELDAEIARRIEHAAEGNPLFVEELVRMLVDDGALVLDDGRWVARDVGELPDPAVDQRAAGREARRPRARGTDGAAVRVGDRQAVLVERRRRARADGCSAPASARTSTRSSASA